MIKKYLLPFLIVLFLVSCGKDDGPSENDDSEKFVGTYPLSAVNISPAQDPNEDGTASTNLLDEMVCINGTLTITADKQWRLNVTRINVTSITGELYFFSCGDNDNSNGTWTSSNNQISLNGSFEPTVYTLIENTLTRQIGENLPGFQSVSFTKN